MNKNAPAIETLRASIAANVGESLALNRRIHATKGPDRADARHDKRSLGARTRALLLAYALLRDVPYLRVESARTRERPNAFSVARAVDPAGGREAYERVAAWIAAPAPTRAPDAAEGAAA